VLLGACKTLQTLRMVTHWQKRACVVQVQSQSALQELARVRAQMRTRDAQRAELELLAAPAGARDRVDGGGLGYGGRYGRGGSPVRVDTLQALATLSLARAPRVLHSWSLRLSGPPHKRQHVCTLLQDALDAFMGGSIGQQATHAHRHESPPPHASTRRGFLPDMPPTAARQRHTAAPAAPPPPPRERERSLAAQTEWVPVHRRGVHPSYEARAQRGGSSGGESSASEAPLAGALLLEVDFE
jgi:hypothetical protein